MSFARAKREFYMEKDAKRKSGLPGPQSYDPKSGKNERGFRYHDLTASTIHEDSRVSSLNCSRDDIDLHRYTESTPMKRNSTLSSSMRGSKSQKGFGMARSNLDRKKADEEMKRNQEELRQKDSMINELSGKYKNLITSYENIKKLKDELEQVYLKQKQDNEFSEKKVRDLERVLEEREKELKEASWQIEVLQKEKDELTEKEKKMYEQNIMLEDRQLEYIKKLEIENEKYKTLEHENNDYQKRLKEKSDQAQSAELEVYNLKESKATLQDKYAAIKENFSQRTNQIEMFKEELQGKDELSIELKSIIQARETELNELREELSDLREEHNGLESASTEQIIVAEKYQKMCQNMEETLKEQEEDMQRYIAEIKMILEQKTTLETEVKTVQASLTDSFSKNEVLKENNDRLQIQYDQLMKEFIAKNMDFEKIKTDYDETILSLEKERELKAEVLATQQNVDIQSSEERAKLTAEIQKLQSDLQSTKLDLSEAQLQVQVATEGRIKLNDQLQSTQQALEARNIQYDPLKKKYEDQKKEMKELNKAGDYFKRNYYSFKDMNENLSKQLQEAIQKNDNHDKVVSALEEKLLEERKLSEASNKRIKQLLAEVSSVQREASIEKTNKDALKALRDENDDLEVKLASCQTTCQHWKSQFEELERFVTPFRQDLARYAAQSEHLDGENSKKATELHELHVQLAGKMGHQNQKQKIKYVARIKAELQETKEKLSAKECELKKTRRQIESLTDDVNALKGIRRFDPKKAFQSRPTN